ncbi:MAG: DedA family protein [Gammaproteobacteria bacterium]|jgi:membrane-associated protein|nr:DedA family protein [Gammaproteobacteria bacterium]
MDILLTLVDFILHLDAHIAELIDSYGAWTYAILCLIVFVETGLVVMPFLPGDSLLFVAGAFAARGQFDLTTLVVSLVAAAVLGNTSNYWIGRALGPKVFGWENSRFFNRAAFDKTHAFYERHGAVTLIVTRFLPFMRTFSPFVAGVAAMTHARFQFFNIAGGLAWVVSLCVAGYWFGNITWIREHLTLVILALIIIPALPTALVAGREWLAARRRAA